MELAKIRNLSAEELKHQEKTSAEQLFRLRFQVAMGQNDGVKKLRQLRKEIAQIKTVARERELGIHGETKEMKQAASAAETKTPKAKQAAAVVEAKAEKVEEAAPASETKTRKTKKAAPAAETKKTKSEKAKGARK
jgi:large subunit ribosomal protein L29